MTETQRIFRENGWGPGTVLTSRGGTVVLVTGVGMRVFLGIPITYSTGYAMKYERNWPYETKFALINGIGVRGFHETQPHRIPTDPHIIELISEVRGAVWSNTSHT